MEHAHLRTIRLAASTLLVGLAATLAGCATPVATTAGEQARAAGPARISTEAHLDMARESAEQAVSHREAFMAMVAHELKAPLAAMAQIEAHHEEAARLDGVTLWQMLRFIVAPILAPAAVVSALMVFLVAFYELTVSALLWSSGTETLGVVLFSLKEAGLAGEAAAVAISASAVTEPSVPTVSARSVRPWRIASTPSWMAVAPEAQAVDSVTGSPRVPKRSARRSEIAPKAQASCRAGSAFSRKAERKRS